MRVLQTSSPKLDSTIRKGLEKPAYDVGFSHVCLVKSAGEAVITHALAGKLFVSKSGWLLLSVPSALVRGAFDSLDEIGVELPTHNGQFQSHITVMNKSELDDIGGLNKITERGHSFHYNLGPIKTVTPKSWDGISKVWFIECNSPELKELRRSYGLSALPNEDHPYHISFAVKKKNVTRTNTVSKAASILGTAVPGLAALTLRNVINKPVEKKKVIKKKDDISKAVESVKDAAEKHHKLTHYKCTISIMHGLTPNKKEEDSDPMKIMSESVSEFMDKLIKKFDSKQKKKDE